MSYQEVGASTPSLEAFDSEWTWTGKFQSKQTGRQL
jgi:hypothetical protein